MGSGFINQIFMVPYSVVLSLMPPYKFGQFFQTLSYFTRIHYIPIFNTTAVIPKKCQQYYSYIGQVGKNKECHWIMYNTNIYVPPGVLYQYFMISKEYLNKMKYHIMT